MKNSISSLFVALLVSTGVLRGQDNTSSTSSTTTTTSETAVEAKRSLPDAIVMSGGGLALLRNGTARRVDQEIALAGGAKVSPGGTVTTSDGATTNLRDGQMITMDGKISAAPANVVSAASNVLAAGTSGPGVNNRDAAETAAAAEVRAYSTTTAASPTPTGTTTPTPSGEVMGGRLISPDQPVGNPNPSPSPSGGAVRRNGGTTR